MLCSSARDTAVVSKPHLYSTLFSTVLYYGLLGALRENVSMSKVMPECVRVDRKGNHTLARKVKQTKQKMQER